MPENPLRPHDHDHDQEEREKNHPVLRELPQPLGQDDVEHGSQDRAGDRAQPPDHDHDDDLERLDEGERVRVHVHEVVSEEPARNARHGRRDDERNDLGTRRIDAHGLGGDLVFPDRDEGPPERRADDPRDDQDGRAGEEVDPREVREPWNSREAAGASDRIDVQDEHPDDLPEAERDDRKIVAAQPERRHSHEKPGDGGAGRPDSERDQQ